MRVKHDIFNTPNKVKLTISEQSTPKSYYSYPAGKDLGDTMPMWRVQTEGYVTHPGQLIGLVSSGDGFLDSPDTEWISGGVNTKGPNAVALGRHGNFFHWGFAASPTYMTDEAKLVFVNAVHHIAKYAGQIPIARKKRWTLTRHYIDATIDAISDDGYARSLARHAAFVEGDKKRKAEIQKRIDAGEEVSQRDRQMLGYPEPKPPSRFRRAERLIPPEVLKELGEDHERISAYLRANRPYFYPGERATLHIDKELKSIGIASDDPALLDRLVVMHVAKNQRNRRLAETLLERYTTQSFNTGKEWADWLQHCRSRLFFTEAGGYKWLVDTTGESSTSITSSQSSKVARASQSDSASTVQATPDSPVASGLTVKALGDQRYELTLVVDVLKGWHTYDLVPTETAYKPLEIALELPDGARKLGEWQRPKGTPSAEAPGLTIFEGRLAFRCQIECAKPTKVSCRVSYQVCDDRRCLPPAETTHSVSIPVARPQR